MKQIFIHAGCKKQIKSIIRQNEGDDIEHKQKWSNCILHKTLINYEA
jgi:hypothetical protein